MKLRPYQQLAIDNIRQSFAKGSESVCFQLPTGGGKTILAAFMIQGSVSKGNKVLFLVHLKELIDQTSEKLSMMGIDHGIISSGYPSREADVQIASVQTLTRRMKQIDFTPSFIIIDECHHAIANSYRSILYNWSQAKVIGLTATPQRLSGEGLDQVFNSLVLGPKPDVLMNEGFLSPYKLYGPPSNLDLSSIRTRAGDYNIEELDEAIDKSTILGDAVTHYRTHLDGRKVIAFCSNIKHSQTLVKQFQAAGVQAEHVDGKCSKEDRNAIIDRFRSGETKVLTNCALISEGFDVPDCDGIILLRPTQSLTIYLQQIGRALRPQQEKTAIILDHVGNYLRHGLPDQDREWTIKSTKKKRKKKTEEEDIQIQTCKTCFIVFDSKSKKCPNCGAEPEVKDKAAMAFIEGNLQEIKEAEIKPKFSTEEVKQMKRKCATLQDYEKLALALGYKSGWAWHQWKLKDQWKKSKFKTGSQ